MAPAYAVDSITGFSNVSGSASDQQRIIGFYQIQDENGTIFDPVTQSMLAPTRENKASYINAVLANANSPSKGFSQPGTEGRLRTFLEGGYLYAPFVQTLTRNGLELYLPFPAVSSDSYQHAVPLANNTWGFNSSPDPGRRNQFDSSMALSFDVPPPFVCATSLINGTASFRLPDPFIHGLDQRRHPRSARPHGTDHRR